METTELLSSAIEALTNNKTRTGLATLGIIIGIASVIALVAMGQGTQKSVQNQIQSLGSNLLTVSPSGQASGGVRAAGGTGTTLTYDDAKAISSSSEITTVSAVSPELTRRLQVIAGSNNTNTQIVGAIPTYQTVRNVTLQTGSFFTDEDINTLSRVAILGNQAANDLFGDPQSAIGQTIRINKLTFNVIGVAAAKGGTGFLNQDDMIFIPLTTAQKLIFGVNYVSAISVQAKSPDVMTDAQNQIGYLLLARHNLQDPSQADFSILSQQDILDTASQTTGTFTALLSGIAAISLLVGGIGIMNIMLVTVIERTREIGLRKALGAKKKTIIYQFLVESIILTGAGGVLGMLLGVLLSFGLSILMKLPFALSVPSMVLAIGVSGVIGVVFGWYPAYKASNLSPIEALRYE